uniref:Centrosomal protein 83 n=1 Tax=Nothobranchius furzeri TaxID=105023 RepID=A0A8C6VUQ8_NOTFU
VLWSAAMLGLSAGLGGAELELQKMLIDERIKCEHHKTNYQTLQAEHASLQDELLRSQGELKRLQGERLLQQEKLQQLLADLRGQLLDKNRELEELRLQVMTPQRLELLRAQVQQEMEAPVRARFIKLEEEAEKYRSEFNKLRYDFTVLQSQSELQREEHARVLEERRICYDAEIARLEKDRDELVAQYQGSNLLHDGKRVEALLREKAQLHVRLKGLEAEVAELQAQKENSGQQAENVQRLQIRQLSEFQATVKSLEAERQSLSQQLERLENERRLSHEQNSQLMGRLHKAEREVGTLTSQLESLKHSHKVEITSIKLECSRSKAEAERERDSLQSQVDGLLADVEEHKAAAERFKKGMVDKEKEVVRKVQAAREEEFRKAAVLHDEKLELESRLTALEKQRALQEASDYALKEEWAEQVRSAQLGEESARRELQNLRSASSWASPDPLTLGSFMGHSHLYRLGVLSRSESDLMETNQRMRDALERVSEELRAARVQSDRSQHEAERLLENRQIEWLEEKRRLQEREAELKKKYSQVKEKLQRAAVAQKKRKLQTENRENKQQQKIQLLEAKVEELELEAATARKGTSSAPPASEGAAASTQRVPTPPEGEFSVLARRMENLESAQQQQLEELAFPVEKE